MYSKYKSQNKSEVSINLKEHEFVSTVRQCELCGKWVFTKNYPSHMRSCLYRFEFDPELEEDRNKAKLALRLTRIFYGEDIFSMMKEDLKQFGLDT